MAWLADLLKGIANTARGYGVQPLTFTVIFIVSIPVFWGGVFVLGRGALDRAKPLLGSSRGDVALGIGICLAAWAAPYAYVLLCGRSLPGWFWLAFTVVLVLSGRAGWRRVAKARNPSGSL